jgi:transposase
MFQDEARFGRLSRCRNCWAKFPLRPTVKAMLIHQYAYAYGAVSIPQGNFDSLVLPHVNGDCMGLYLAEVSQRYPDDNIVMVLDGAGWHKNKAMPIPENIRLLSLPSYSPELNPVEHLWDELREKHFYNRAFESHNALEDHLVGALRSLENNPELVQSICNWDWIINALSIAH